jgi:hypothetical protein
MSIHKYKFKDQYILLDVNSSVVFLIDELIYDLLNYYPENHRRSGFDPEIKIFPEDNFGGIG